MVEVLAAVQTVEALVHSVVLIFEHVASATNRLRRVPPIVADLCDRAHDIVSFLKLSLSAFKQAQRDSLSAKLMDLKTLGMDMSKFTEDYCCRTGVTKFLLNRRVSRLCEEFQERFLRCHQDLQLLIITDVHRQQADEAKQRGLEEARRDDLRKVEEAWRDSHFSAIEEEIHELLDAFRGSTIRDQSEDIKEHKLLLKDLLRTLKSAEKYSSTIEDAEKVLQTDDPGAALREIDKQAYEALRLPNHASTIRIDRQIARGSFGDIREVWNQGERQAAKRLLDAKDTEKLWREVRLQNMARNGYVMRIFGHKMLQDSDNNFYPFFFMEYAYCGDFRMLMEAFEGCRSLRRRFSFPCLQHTAAATLSLPVVSLLFFEISLGLEHIHSIGMIHRDLKFENVLITADGIPKITDFATAKEGATNRHTPDVGTTYFQAPEARDDDRPEGGKLRYGSLYDYYSFASMLHCFLHRLYGNTHERVPPKDRILPVTDFPMLKPLERIRKQGLSRDPRQRFGPRSQSKECLSNSMRTILCHEHMGGNPREPGVNPSERKNLADLIAVLENLQEEKMRGSKPAYEDIWTECTGSTAMDSAPYNQTVNLASLISKLQRVKGNDLRTTLEAIAFEKSAPSEPVEVDSVGDYISVLLTVMNNNLRDERIQICGAKAIFHLVKGAPSAVSRIAFDLIGTLLRGMTRHLNPTFLIYGSYVVRDVCQLSVERQTYAKEERVFSILSNALRNNRDHTRLRAAVCATYAALCRSNEQNQVVMFDYLGDLVESMTKFKSNPTIVTRACSAIFFVAANEFNARELVKLRVLPCLVRAVQTTSGSSAILALSKVCSYADTIKIAVCDFDATSTVVDFLRRALEKSDGRLEEAKGVVSFLATVARHYPTALEQYQDLEHSLSSFIEKFGGDERTGDVHLESGIILETMRGNNSIDGTNQSNF